MIEKFNFYDIYGYFLPGLAFLGVLWLPFMMVHPALPPSEWGSAIAALALAYLLGHLLQGLATNALPSKISANNRFPSAALLDPNSDLPIPVRSRIAEIVLTKFGLDLKVNEPGVAGGEVDKVRNGAFNLARLVLSKDKLVSYPEQFEGMYALSRGLAVGLGLGFPYFLGWAVSSREILAKVMCFSAVIVAPLLIVLCSLVAKRKAGEDARTVERTCLFAIAIALLCAGYYFGQRHDPYHSNAIHFGLVAMAMLIASLRFYGAYKFFATHFAKTVWRDFLAFNAIRAADPKAPA